ncbi:DUF3857 domain-containing protein [Aquimarina brevivitae]|uniref:Transglutaminase-like putative cysteine protease n=1 Tax=Aquimarina brevivitae TaxID=323412 RepID=A0A4Q7NYT7_9FLAO|nr:transglutaminase domain-containing protein [Aquimarina brevivitae]RZS92210.1 transglutaminase-like putative cysteine protease [Aquimarina brevivitae]
MKNCIAICSILLVFTIGVTQAQEYKFGKVSKEELLEKSHPLDSTASAAVLYENQEVYIEYTQSEGFRLITDVFKRVKIYDKEGFEYASDKRYLYKKGGDDEILTGLKAVTYNLSGDKIEETKLKKDGIFKNEFSEYYDEVKFTMPAIDEGSVVEYKYKVVSPFLFSMDRIYLQYEIPIKKLEVNVKSPEYFVYKKFTTGYLPIDLKTSQYNDKVILTTKNRRGVGFNGNTTRTDWSRDEVNFVVNKESISLENVPAFKEEPYAGNIDNFISSILYELSFVNFPQEPIEYYSTTWEDVSKRIYSSSSFGGEIDKSNYYKEELANVISGVSNPVDKTALIYNFVKNKVTWNGKYGVFSSEGVKKCFKEGTGNVAEINLMLTSMLRTAGINAYPVIASSSSKPVSLFPSIDGFNYVLTLVKFKEGGSMLLDATDKIGYPNVLPSRIIRGVGRVITEDGNSKMVNLRPSKPTVLRTAVQCQISEQGVVEGKLSNRYATQYAHSYRSYNISKSKADSQKDIIEKYNLSEAAEIELEGLNQVGKGVVETLSFKTTNEVEVIEDEMYFSPLLFLKENENIFKAEDRQYPVDFGYGFSDSYMINIKIPEGYEVVELPKSGAFKLPNNLGSFTYRTNFVNGTIQVVVNETIATPVITSNYYLALKEFYNQIVQKEGEQVVLKKV